MGGLVGISYGAFKAFKSKSPTFLKGLLFSAGFGIFGAQLGFITGLYSARALIYELPDRQKFKRIANELVDISAEESRKSSSGWTFLRLPKGQPVVPQNPREPRSVTQPEKDDGVEDLPGESEPAPSQEGSAWDRIRNVHMGKQSEWDKVRRGEADLAPLQRDPNTNPSTWDKVRQAGNDNFYTDTAPPEALVGASKGSRSSGKVGIQRNKYGDIVELPDEAFEDDKY